MSEKFNWAESLDMFFFVQLLFGFGGYVMKCCQLLLNYKFMYLLLSKLAWPQVGCMSHDEIKVAMKMKALTIVQLLVFSQQLNLPR